MNSYIDEIIKQQKLIERAFGGAPINEIMRQLNAAEELNNYYKNLGLPKSLWNDQIPGIHSTQHFLRQIEESSAAARIAKDADAILGFTAIEQAHKVLTRVPWGEGSPLHSLLENIDKAALQAARHFDNFSTVSAITRELDATQRMLASSGWAALTGQTLKAFQTDLLERYSTDSLYRELMRTMQAVEASEDSTVEDEADSIFDAIWTYLVKHSKKLTLHNFVAVFDVVFTVLFHLYLMHHLEQFVETKIDEKIKASSAETVEAVNNHATAVAEALYAKIEAGLAELATQSEEARVVTWAAGDKAVVARIVPEHGGKRVGELLPGQRVIQFGEERQWIQVEFQDHKAGVPKLGWALKKNLTRVTPPRQRGSGE